MDFQYSLDATSLTTGTWIDVDALDFVAPVTAGTVGALDGNAAANRTAKSAAVTSLSIASNAIFYVRWVDFNATGADDGLAIDELTLQAGSVTNGAPTLTAGGSATYAGVPVVIDNTITITDDGPTLVGATASITAGFVPADDRLLFTNANGITGAYNATSGILTLSGSATLANYQAALRSIQYNNVNANPAASSRTISWQVNDGSATNNLSAPVTSTVTITDASNAPLGVASVTSLASGVKVQFSRAVDVSKINLYDQGNTLGASDVTLVGTNTGPVRGSLIFNADNKGFTFIKTGMLVPTGTGAAPGTLEPDTYTLTLRSNTTNGFSDTAGNALRDASGSAAGDYITTFTVASRASNTLTISVPDFARGFSQTVNLPNSVTSGLPVVLSNGNNVSGVDFVLNYNPALLSITGFTSTITGATVSVNIATRASLACRLPR